MSSAASVDAAPAAAAPAAAPAALGAAASGEELAKQIEEQGTKVRGLKASGAAKDAVDEAVKLLLALKLQYKEVSFLKHLLLANNSRRWFYLVLPSFTRFILFY